MATASDISGYLYTPLFCEENIWQLVKSFLEQGIAQEAMQVLLFSNPAKRVVFYQQQTKDQRGYVVWDYHVVLRVVQGGDDLIYDFDTDMPFPVTTIDYFTSSFPVLEMLKDEFTVFVREVSAVSYLKNFYSDRSHMESMRGEINFPEWKAITPEHKNVISLATYWDMHGDLNDGSQVYELSEYIRRHLS